MANGHTYPEADMPLLDSSYEQINSLFENSGGQFVEVTDSAGPGLAVRGVSRGASFADYDADGDVDIFVLNLNALPTLLRNDSNQKHHYLQVKLVGRESNRDGIGARVQVEADGRMQYAEVQSGGSYLSHSDMSLHFGLSDRDRVNRLIVDWPSGRRQEIVDIEADQLLTVYESLD